MADSRATRPGHANGDGDGDGDLGYLLVQLGFHVARRFSEQLAPLGLEPRQFGMLAQLAANEGRSQQAIGELVGLNATRMVFLVDELEQRGLVERRRNPADRRSHALYLTDLGRAKLREAQQASGGSEGQLGASLTEQQRTQLTRLLRRLADEQGIAEGSLPGPPPGVR
jgi:DNA-binding MarR family transcriptional regulator